MIISWCEDCYKAGAWRSHEQKERMDGECRTCHGGYA